MLLRWLRRRRVARTPFPQEWETILRSDFAYWLRLSEGERARLRKAIQLFILDRHWEGCGGLSLTVDMQVLIAAQASLLILERPDDEFRNVTSVLVYPGGYFARAQPAPVLGGSRVMDLGPTPVLGQAFERGPVILSWQHARRGAIDAEDGGNVVFHEFAHKLDMMNGFVDGTPRMESREEARRWHHVMTDALEKLEAEMRSGVFGPLRPYAATNPAEFFAVGTEVFFERPAALRAWDPDMYEVMAAFYRQDPARRLEERPE